MIQSRIDALRFQARTQDSLSNGFSHSDNPKTIYAPPYSVTQQDGGHRVLYMAYERSPANLVRMGLPQSGSDILKSVFVFPIPPAINDVVTTEWDDEGSFLKSVAGAVMGSDGVIDAGKNVAKTAGKQIEKAVGSATPDFVAFDPQDFYFKGVGKREWSFTHKLTPTTLSESNDMKILVDTLQYHASPMLESGGMAHRLAKPAEWEIHFLSGKEDNRFLPKLNRCVLESVNINNTPNDGFQPSQGNSFPNEIDIEITFKEMLIRTKNDIAKFGNLGE